MKREELAAVLDDAAATGDYDTARDLGLSFPWYSHERRAALYRARAIGHRLDGRVQEALVCERQSQLDLGEVPA